MRFISGQKPQNAIVETQQEIPIGQLSGKEAVADNNEEERQLSLWYVLLHHKGLVWWCFFFAVSAIGWGFDAQVNSAVISVPAFRKQFGYLHHGNQIIPAPWVSAFNMISSIGQFFGGFLCSSVVDRIGRRRGLAIGMVISCGGILGEVFSTHRVAFLVSKWIVGVGLGFYLTIGPLYCSEVSPVVLRGITTAGVNLGIVVGQLLSNAAIRGFGCRDDSWGYRGPFAIQLFFIAFFALGLPFSVESPWYLVRRNDIDGARRALQRLYGKNTDVETKLKAMLSTTADEATLQKPRWVDCFRGTDCLRTYISIGVFVCQQLSGIIFVMGFSTYLFQLAGVAVYSSFDLGIGVTACGVMGTIVSWFVVNSYGRRKIFLVGMVGLTVCLLLIGILDVVPTRAAGWMQASFTVVYALIYQATIGSVAFVLLGEVSSTRLRAKTTALATATQSAFGIAMNVAVPYMVNPDAGNMNGKVGFVFGGLALACTVVSYFYIPELKGRTFDEIDTLFVNRVSPRRMGHYLINHY
ncbi:hypothetical protein DTO271G3_4320 [Paecilomyces variotii]|nr:hypothetical protein DTO271G3_4320 [Paecilomyces variotii]